MIIKLISNTKSQDVENKKESAPRTARKQILLLLLTTFFLLSTIIGVYALQQATSYRSKAAEIKNLSPLKVKRNPSRVEWKEVGIDKPQKNKPIKVNVTKTKLNNISSLPITGQWEGHIVRVVPNDRFTDPYKNYGGVTAIQGMSDGRIFLGTYDYFGIKEPDDTDWAHITYYDLQLQFSTSITFFTETMSSPHEVYFGDDYTSGGKTVRMKTDGTFELIVDPTDLYGYLRNVKVVPYKDNNGVVAYRSSPILGELYYVEQGSLRKWLTPVHSCGQQILADKILAMVTDPDDENKTYGIVTEYLFDQYCNSIGYTYLYQYIFSSDPDIPLEIIKLGKITGDVSGGTGGSNNKQTFLSKRLDDPTTKILYYGPPEQPDDKDLFIIPYFYDDGQDMEVFSYNIAGDPPWGDPWIYDFSAQLKPNGETDNLWFASREYYGVYLGREYDNGNQGFFIRTTDTSILANPWMNTISTDKAVNTIYTGHSYTPGQFNDGMITVFEGPSPSSLTKPLLQNSSFEKDLNNLPDLWKTKNLDADDVLDTTIVYDGKKSFKFSPSNGKKEMLYQAVNHSGSSDEEIKLEVYNQSDGWVTSGKTGVILTIFYWDGRQETVSGIFPRKPHEWQKKFLTIITDNSYNRLVVNFFNISEGTIVRIDKSNLLITSDASKRGVIETSSELTEQEIGEIN